MRNIELYATLKVLKNNYYNKKVIDNCIRDIYIIRETKD